MVQRAVTQGDAMDKFDDLTDELRQEFVDETIETLQALDVLLNSARNGHSDQSEVIAQFRRVAVKVRGPANTYGFRPLASIAYRVTDYLTSPPRPLPPRAWDDMQTFLDMMMMVVEDRLPLDRPPAQVIRDLPNPLGFNPAEIERQTVDVLLVMPRGAQTHFVVRELQQCGYRVSVVSDTIEAFAQVVQTQPNLIIISALMPHLDGYELAIALMSMPSTRNIPIAVITSLTPADDRLSLLPGRIPIVYKGPSFADDLFKALDRLFLI